MEHANTANHILDLRRMERDAAQTIVLTGKDLNQMVLAENASFTPRCRAMGRAALLILVMPKRNSYRKTAHAKP